MGYRFQTIQLKSDEDAVKVTIHSRNDAVNEKEKKYNFKLWLPASKIYTTSTQTFTKYSQEYPWSKLDNLIGGDTVPLIESNPRYNTRYVSFSLCLHFIH